MIDTLKAIECATGEVVYSYDDYLKTKHWENVKSEYKKHFIYKCTMCDEVKELHLHHMTYQNIGHEKLLDLVYLCRKCHRKIHEATDVKQTKVLGVLVENHAYIKPNERSCVSCFHYNRKYQWCKLHRKRKVSNQKCRRFRLYRDRVETTMTKPTRYGEKGIIRKLTYALLEEEYKIKASSAGLIKLFNNKEHNLLGFGNSIYTIKVININEPILIEILKKDARIGVFELIK